ncbi:hypothetical protein ACFL59_02490 [Planctomycetota bacterium]
MERIVEAGKRLSESLLWDMQRRFYKDMGIDAWRGGFVPSLASSNALVARAYVDAILGYVKDSCSPSGTDEPVYVVELGSGTGRLAFLILRALDRLRKIGIVPKDFRLKYVMTDMAEPLVQFWRSHAPLRPFVEAGCLDFARWAHEEGPRIELRESGEVLDEKKAVNGIVVIANYVFDSMKADAFHVKDGALYESRVSVIQSDSDSEGSAGNNLSALSCKFADHPVPGDYYEDIELNHLLGAYKRILRDGSVLLPVGAVKCLQSLLSISDGRMLLLSADKGEAHPSAFTEVWDWMYTIHGGCFSFMANLHAIGLFVERRGGMALHSPDARDAFRFSAFVLPGDNGCHVPQTLAALDRPLNSFAFCDLLALIEPAVENPPNLDGAMAVVKLSEYDPYVFGNFEKAIDRGIDEIGETERLALLRLLRLVEANDYHLDDYLDLSFALGRLYYKLDLAAEAVRLYEASLTRFGDHEATFANIGLCYEILGDDHRALKYHRHALEINPAYELALQRLSMIKRGKRAAQ